MREESTHPVYYERHLGEPLSEQTRQELRELATVPDEEIDFSDIPKQDPGEWKDAKLFHDVFRQTGKSVLLDEDILTWLKAGGQGHRERANNILRERMLSEQQGK